MDFNQMPKLIADAWHLNNSKQWFFFGFSSGSKEDAYLLSPPVAKTFLLELKKRIDKYEQEHGEIDTKGAQTVIHSPIQM